MLKNMLAGITAVLIAGGAAAGPLEDGFDAVKRGDYATALMLWKPLAEQGNVAAAMNLGFMYEKGNGVPKDSAEAKKWFRIAEQGAAKTNPTPSAGSPPANAKLLSRPEIDAIRLAAERGVAEAQSSLGAMYATGQGVPQDYAEAVKWFRLAAEQGSAFAQNNLGELYASGSGVPQDDTQAVELYRRAADQGYADGQSNLGSMYSAGRGVPQDIVQAHRWFNLAAAQGNEAGIKNRDLIARRMTPEEITEAQRLAKEAEQRGRLVDNLTAERDKLALDLSANETQLSAAASKVQSEKAHSEKLTQDAEILKSKLSAMQSIANEAQASASKLSQERAVLLRQQAQADTQLTQLKSALADRQAEVGADRVKLAELLSTQDRLTAEAVQRSREINALNDRLLFAQIGAVDAVDQRNRAICAFEGDRTAPILGWAFYGKGFGGPEWQDRVFDIVGGASGPPDYAAAKAPWPGYIIEAKTNVNVRRCFPDVDATTGSQTLAPIMGDDESSSLMKAGARFSTRYIVQLGGGRYWVALQPPPNTETSAIDTSPQVSRGADWLVVLSTFADYENAASARAQLTSRRIPSQLIDTDDYADFTPNHFAVVLGPYTKGAAELALLAAKTVSSDSYVKFAPLK